MGVLFNGQMVWQVGDIVYCEFNELLRGPFIILKVLPDGLYQGKFVGGMCVDFSVRYQVKSSNLRTYQFVTTPPPKSQGELA